MIIDLKQFIKNKILNKYYFYITFTAIILAVFLLPFYSNNKVILGGEGDCYLNYKCLLDNYSSAWSNAGAGFPATSMNFAYFNSIFLFFLDKIINNIQIVNFILIFLLLYLPFLAMFLLCREFKANPITSFIISAFYLVNPFSLYFLTSLNHWNALAIFVVPIYFLIIYKFYKSNILLFIIFGLFSFLFAFTNANPPLMVVYQIAIIISLILSIVIKEQKFVLKIFIEKYIILLISFILFNIWWILNWFNVMSDVTKIYTSNFAVDWATGISDYYPYLIWKTLTFTNLLPITKNENFYGLFYNNFLSYFVVCIPILIVIYYFIKEKALKPIILFIISLLTILVFLSKGTSSPFGFIYKAMLIYVPFFSVFKTPPEKWGVLYVFLFAFLLIYIFTANKKWKKLKYMLILLAFYNIYCAIPIITFNFAPDYKMFGGKDNIGSRKYYDKIEYKKLREIINSDINDCRVLSLPGSLNYQVALRMDNGKYYTGMDPILSNTTKQVIEQYSPNIYSNYNELYDNISDDSYSKLLSLYNIGKIVINKDMIPWFGYREKEDVKKLESIFENNNRYIKNKEVNENVLLYDVKKEYQLARIYSSKQILPVVGEPHNCELMHSSFYSEYPAIAYSTQQPYSFNILKANSSQVPIVLLNSDFKDLFLDRLSKKETFWLAFDNAGLTKFRISGNKTYEIWLQPSVGFPDEESQKVYITIDEKLTCQVERSYANERWIKLNINNLEKGVHSIRLKVNEDRKFINSIVALPAGQMENKTNYDISKFPDISLEYLFLNNSNSDINYKLYANKNKKNKVKILLSPANKLINNEKPLTKTYWQIIDKGILYNYNVNPVKVKGLSMTKITELPLKANLLWDNSKWDENVCFKKEFNNMKLKENKYLYFDYQKDDSIKDIELRIWIKDNNYILKLESFDIGIKDFIHPVFKKQYFITNLYEKAKEYLRTEKDVNIDLIRIDVIASRKIAPELKIIKSNSNFNFQINCLKVEKEEPFIINNNMKYLSRYENPSKYYYLQGDELKSCDNVMDVPKEIEKVETINYNDYLDLKESPQFDFTLQRENKGSNDKLPLNNISLKLYLDFTGNSNITNELIINIAKVKANNEFPKIENYNMKYNIFDYVKKKFPTEKVYHLLSFKILDNVDKFSNYEYFPKTLYLTNYDKKQWPIDEWKKQNPVIEINKKKIYFNNASNINTKSGNVQLEFNSLSLENENKITLFKNECWQTRLFEFTYDKSEFKDVLPVVSYKKVNPSKYIVDVNTVQTFPIVFSEAYNPNWKAYINSKELPSEMHFMVNGYANGFIIDKIGKYQIVFEYAPQSQFYIGMGITIFICIGSVIFAIAMLIRRKNHESK